MITLVLVLRDSDGDFVGVLIGVLGVFGVCTTTLLDCRGILFIAVLPPVFNTRDLGGVGFMETLDGDFVTGF